MRARPTISSIGLLTLQPRYRMPQYKGFLIHQKTQINVAARRTRTLETLVPQIPQIFGHHIALTIFQTNHQYEHDPSTGCGVYTASHVWFHLSLDFFMASALRTIRRIGRAKSPYPVPMARSRISIMISGLFQVRSPDCINGETSLTSSILSIRAKVDISFTALTFMLGRRRNQLTAHCGTSS